MKNALIQIVTIVALSSATFNVANAYQIHGTGNLFGSGYEVYGNTLFGTGNNFGGGWEFYGNRVFGTGSNFGSGYIWD